MLKEVKLPDFLASQIAQRIRFNFGKDSREEAKGGGAASRPLFLVDGAFDRAQNARSFRFSILALKSDDPHRSVLEMFKFAAEVLKAYGFADYDTVDIQDYLNRQKLEVPRQAVRDYLDKKLNDDQILRKYLTESKSIQEAFKLFGFNAPQEPAEDAAGLVPATP